MERQSGSVVTDERMTKLEEVLAHYIQVQERELSAIRTSVAEIQLSVAQIRASNARTDTRLLELHEQADKDRQQADKDRQQAEKDRQQAEKDRQQAEKDRKDFNRRLAELSDSMGTLIEDMVAPCGFKLAQAIFGTEEAAQCAIRVKRKHPVDPAKMMELDLLAIGPSKVLVVEVKRRLHPGHIDEYKSKLEVLTDFFPELAGKIVCPAVASVYLEPAVLTFLNREKVYGIAMGDEVMEVVNLGQF